MYLAVSGSQVNMSIVERKGGIDNNHIIGHRGEVILCLRLIRRAVGLRKNRVSGIGVEERVDDEGAASAVVDTYCR